MGVRRSGKLQDPPAALNRFTNEVLNSYNNKEGDKKETFYNEKAENRQRLQLNRTHHCYCNHGRTGCRMCPMYIKYIHKAGVARDWANLKLYYDEIQADYVSTGEYNPKVKALSAETPEETGYMGLKQIDSLNGDTIKMKAGIFVVKKTKSGYHIYYQCNKCSDPHHSATCDLVLGN